ncbi:YaaL family protein [Secundilactobacillus kimchicus]|uniref:YaaL family protein n=1 Tax=Secundilactobacillus kimchicus TaxID=528209 RepID=UPI000AEC811C
MFGSKKQRLRHEFDDKLLDAIERAKQEWDQAKETEIAVADVDVEMTSQTALARQKYLFFVPGGASAPSSGQAHSSIGFRLLNTGSVPGV